MRVTRMTRMDTTWDWDWDWALGFPAWAEAWARGSPGPGHRHGPKLSSGPSLSLGPKALPQSPIPRPSTSRRGLLIPETHHQVLLGRSLRGPDSKHESHGDRHAERD